MDERQAQGLLARGMASVGWRLFKMVDGAAGKRPFDITGVSPTGVGVAIEMKTERPPRGGEAALPWGDFATHQKAWLRIYAEAGAYALVAVHNGVTNAVTLYRLSANDVDSPAPRSRLESVEVMYIASTREYIFFPRIPWK